MLDSSGPSETSAGINYKIEGVQWPSNRLGEFQSSPLKSLDVITATELTSQDFKREYVDKCRPCLIKGAVDHWPAMRQWAKPGYLEDRVGDGILRGVRNWPKMEHTWREKWSSEFQHSIKASMTQDQIHKLELPFHDFLEGIQGLDFLWCHAIPVSTDSFFRSIANDVGGFKFLASEQQVSRGSLYPPLRVFFFGRSYTDWHSHPMDETLMCQIGAAKQIAVAAPDLDTWTEFYKLLRDGKEYVSDSDVQKSARFRNKVYSLVTVEPGDATYIPPFWLHAVETIPEPTSWGATVAYCWRSPSHIQFDPRFPRQRQLFKEIYSNKRRVEYISDLMFKWLPEHLRGNTLSKIPS